MCYSSIHEYSLTPQSCCRGPYSMENLCCAFANHLTRCLYFKFFLFKMELFWRIQATQIIWFLFPKLCQRTMFLVSKEAFFFSFHKTKTEKENFLFSLELLGKFFHIPPLYGVFSIVTLYSTWGTEYLDLPDFWISSGYFVRGIVGFYPLFLYSQP